MAGEEFSVLTYNVNFGLARERRDGTYSLSDDTDNVIDAVATTTADIVVLQETNSAWQHAFNSYSKVSMNQLYPHQRWLHQSAAGGSAILCRSHVTLLSCELVDTRKEVEGSWFKQLVARVEIFEKNIIVVGVHLRPPKGLMFWTTSIRRQEMMCVMNSIEQTNEQDERDVVGTPLLVMGDFNEDDGYSALSYLQSEYQLVDALNQFVDQRQETMEVDVPMLFGAFYWHRKFRLDHICYSEKHFICKECRVVSGYRSHASDHQPVFANFHFR